MVNGSSEVGFLRRCGAGGRRLFPRATRPRGHLLSFVLFPDSITFFSCDCVFGEGVAEVSPAWVLRDGSWSEVCGQSRDKGARR